MLAHSARYAATARVPQSKNLYKVASNAIVEVITNPREMQASHALRTRAYDRRANARLRGQKQESLREILVEGFRSTIAIFIPPVGGAIDLSLCPLGDADVHELRAATRELGKNLFGRHGFPTIGFRN